MLTADSGNDNDLIIWFSRLNKSWLTEHSDEAIDGNKIRREF